MKTIARIIFGLACTLLAAGAVSGQTYSIDWHTIDGGGGTSAGSGFSMNATIGQFDAGPLTGGGYTLDGGFWSVTEADESTVTLFNNTNGINNGVQAATTTSWLAGKFCMGSQSFGLEAVTLLLSSQRALGAPQPSTVRLQIYADDPIGGIPSTNTGVAMNLSGMANPITLPLGSDDVLVKWTPAATFTLAANTCYWVVLSEDDGVSVSETASVSAPTGVAAAYGRVSSNNGGATWSNLDNTSNFKMLIEGNTISSVALVITNVSILGNTLHFFFPSSVGRSYVVESRTALESGTWAEVPLTQQTGTGALVEVSLPISLLQPHQFFRVKQLP